ncbi:hypothetical protein CN918_28645 [Priestia megaterium]|nr:hypothetical protein CN918_28645 [Priestia megaterium]
MHTLYFILYLFIFIAIIITTVKALYKLVDINTEGIDTSRPITKFHRPLEIGLLITFAVCIIFLKKVDAWIIPFSFFIITLFLRGLLQWIYRRERKEWVVSFVILIEVVCLMLIGRTIYIF